VCVCNSYNAAAIAAALVLVLLSLAAGSARAAVPGVAAPELTWGSTDALQDQSAATLAALRPPWVRLSIQWKLFEPNAPGAFDEWWIRHTDRAVDLVDATGANILFVVFDAPAWASGSSSSVVPRDPADFARFLRFLAGRYGAKVDAYELWNEPDLRRFWTGGPDPAAYTSLLRAGTQAVRETDPGATVVFAGLAYIMNGDQRFLDEAYRAGAKGWFDAVGVHTYTYCGTRSPLEVRTYPDGTVTEGSFARYRNLRPIMLAAGDDKPIWITEFGWSTTTQTCDLGAARYGGVTEATQGQYLSDALRFLEQDPYVEVALWYNLRNNHDLDVTDNRYGLVRRDYTLKPSFEALQSYGIAPLPLPVVNAPPAVRLTAPLAGSTFNRSLVMAADASDDAGVARVEFWVDGARVAADTSAPYSFTWGKARKLSFGPHVVTARAYDAEGLSTSASAVAVRAQV
jgi:hypothetical protein